MKHTTIGRREMENAIRSAKNILDISDHKRASIALRAMGLPTKWLDYIDAPELAETGWESVVVDAVDRARENQRYI